MNTYHKFAIPAFTPTLLNISMIACSLWLSPYFKEPIVASAWGVFIAGVTQFVFQLPFLFKLKLMGWPCWGWRDPKVKRIIKLMVPVLFGASVTQVSLLVDTMFASFLPTGSVSWLYYSDRLTQFPLGVFGVALSTVALPYLSTHHANADHKGYERSLDWALRLVVLLGVPAAVGMALLSIPLLSTIFGYGKFTTFDIFMTQRSLIAFSFGLLFFMLAKVVVSAFYAKQDMKTPVKIALWAMAVNVVAPLS